MKTRNGFVSNSSSSSFVVYLPKDFVITDELLEEAFINTVGEEEDFAAFKEQFYCYYRNFLSSKSFYQAENYDVFMVLEELIPDECVLASFDTESDRGEFQIISDEAIKKIKELA